MMDGIAELQAWSDLNAAQREVIESIWRAAENRSNQIMTDHHCPPPTVGVFLTDLGEILLGPAREFIPKTRLARIKLIPISEQHQAQSTKQKFGLQIITYHDDDMP